MRLKGLLKKKQRYAVRTTGKYPNNIPEGIYVQCPKCKGNVYRPDLKMNWGVCPRCGYHYPLSARARLSLIVDKDSFVELNPNLVSTNPLNFPGYDEKLNQYKLKTGEKEAVVTGIGTITGYDVVVVIMDCNFMMGSMGSVIGEKVTRAIEYATAHQFPLVIFTASGGARMQEGIFSLMQMAKTTAALARHDDAGLLYISVLTDPTTGGVTASFATLGDVILAEPGALIGFAGPRVIEQTIHQKLPKEFQKAEFLLQHGQIDQIVNRKMLRSRLSTLLALHAKEAADGFMCMG